ncbi:uncharacterized protein [Montipora foliosa]|uniref:uncharacterized protein n=1 Tax=Montipora foliosa TaxID=591990 RepID=UPI0035F210B4
MPVGMNIEVETVDMDNQPDNASGAELFFPLRKCSTDADCWKNFCCAFGKRCAPKLPEYFTCYFTEKHGCGCMDGMECKITTTITLPIINTKFPIKQCVKA